jgi:pimeloyl-ACP methyl ester carboxylesterase
MRKWRISGDASAWPRPILWLLSFRANGAGGNSKANGTKANSEPARINVPLPTLGGKQIWADTFIHAGWRIQRNLFTNHYRLLDPNKIRRAWGGFNHCREVFERCRTRYSVELRSDHVVLLVHGLGRSADAFAAMEETLQVAGYETANVNYPSTRQGISAHADNLKQVIESFEGVKKLSFVTHSLGGLVMRDLLARRSAWRDRIELHRIVMIAPPNQGSHLANRFKEIPAYQWLTGESGQGLTSEVAKSLPPPDAEFGVIAGGRGNDLGFNPLLPGDDDGFVAVTETHLGGMQDFLLVNTTHGLMDDHPLAINATIAFLRDGRFRPEANDDAPKEQDAQDDRATHRL